MKIWAKSFIIYKRSKAGKQHRPTLKAKGQASVGTQQLLAAGASPGGCRCPPRPGDGDESPAQRGLLQEAARRVKWDQTAPGTSVMGLGGQQGRIRPAAGGRGRHGAPWGDIF